MAVLCRFSSIRLAQRLLLLVLLLLLRLVFFSGISKGKRPLEGAALEEHLAFGERLLREGRAAFVAGDMEMAYMRFKQGVELLNWVEATDSQNQKRVEDMYSLFLKNTAQAALKLGKYQEAIRPPLLWLLLFCCCSCRRCCSNCLLFCLLL